MNMGTPGYPEGVSHWSNKAMYAHKFKVYVRRQKGFWLFFNECCGNCENGGYVENVLAGVTDVKMEGEFDPAQTGGFIPDILLERGELPAIWIEVTDTSPPSERKLTYCARQGIDVFEFNGKLRPVDSSVKRAHISPRNCRKEVRQRLHDLWEHILALDDPIVGIADDWKASSLDWHFRLQAEEIEEKHVRSKQLKQVVREGKLRCTRCGEPFVMFEDGTGFEASFIWSHRQNGSCGKVPMCRNCEFTLRGGWDGDYPEDAGSWGLDDECPRCQPIIIDQQRRLESANRLRSVEMPEPYGARAVTEPEPRPQGYVVGDQTVNRNEIQAVLMLFKYVLAVWLPPSEKNLLMLEEVDRINRAVLYSNNDLGQDWLQGVGESWIAEDDVPESSLTDKFLCPKRWWAELPPCPLGAL